MATEPGPAEAQVGESSVFRPGNHDPLVIIPQLFRIGGQLALSVGELGEVLDDDILPLAFLVKDMPPAEELDIGSLNRLASHRVGDVVPDAIVDRLLDDDGVVEPDDDPAHVAIAQPRLDQVGPGLLQWCLEG